MKKLLVSVLLLMIIFPATIGGIEKVKVPSDEENLENIVIAICWVESDYGRIKKGKAGEKGPAQIMRHEWTFTTRKLMGVGKDNLYNGQDYSWDSAYNPVKNIKVGRIYLNYLHKKYGDWETVVRVYHSGHHGYFDHGRGGSYWAAIQRTLDVGDTSWRKSKIKKKRSRK